MQNSADDRTADGATSSPNPAGSQSESDYLAAQASAAQQAIAQAIQRIRRDLVDGADLKAWTRAHPWPTLGAAAALGFFAAATIGSRRPRDHVAELLAQALADRLPPGAPAKPSMFSGMMNEVVRSFAGVVEGAITGAMSAKMQQATTPTSNGHDQPADSV